MALTFDQMMAFFKETGRQMKERQKQADEHMKEVARWIKELEEERQSLYNRFREIVEFMITPGLFSKSLGPDFIFRVSSTNNHLCDITGEITLGIDICLENDRKAMLVQVENRLTAETVSYHIKQLEKMRVCADSRGDKRTFLGAVVGATMTPKVKEFALSKGFFVIEPSEETFNITFPQGNPKEW
jgi:hypothetical protein